MCCCVLYDLTVCADLIVIFHILYIILNEEKKKCNFSFKNIQSRQLANHFFDHVSPFLCMF